MPPSHSLVPALELTLKSRWPAKKRCLIQAAETIFDPEGDPMGFLIVWVKFGSDLERSWVGFGCVPLCKTY